MDCNWVHLKNVGPPFFKFTVCQFIHVSKCHQHSRKIIPSCYMAMILQIKDFWSANLTFRAHNQQNKQNYLKQRDIAPLKRTGKFYAVVLDLSFNVVGGGGCPCCLLFLKSGDRQSIPKLFFILLIFRCSPTMDVKSQDKTELLAYILKHSNYLLPNLKHFNHFLCSTKLSRAFVNVISLNV